ncbi:GNAT family N-acetyltransferase [Streptomyces sp. TR06-5]|uniref:GNAT family N-acetyltransferase n=1 Tax=Streptomyces sp. TR06-5 TaxID=3385976 RepID=UPI0039A31557
MILTRAEVSDLDRLLQFRRDAAAWLAPLGTDQWSLPFPAENIARSIQAGEVYIVRESPESEAAATITLDEEADPLLWTEAERMDPALYVHKLTVDRRWGGQRLGERLLDWAGTQASSRGARWLRLDAWTTNTRLHRYYEELGFHWLRTVTDPAVGGSGWVAQRPAVPADHGLVEAVHATDARREPRPPTHGRQDCP